MNTQIQKLIDQVGTDVSGKWINIDDAERLVQLVVEECASVVEKNLFKGIGWNTSRAVKKHFGIDLEE